MSFFRCQERILDSFATEQDIIDVYIGGTLWNWGGSTNGAMGNNSTVQRSSPVQTVSTVTTWNVVFGGGSNATTPGSNGGLKNDGTLWMWGSNAAGQLGNNDTINRSSPVQTVSTGTNWCRASAFCTTTSAIKTDGTLWSWGPNTDGRLGNNDTLNRSSPVQTVATGRNWCSVAAGNSVVTAIKSDGTLWNWGINTGGQLGNNTAISRSSPVQTVSTGTNWSKAGSGAISNAIKTDGTLWLWGPNTNGSLGDNTAVANRSSPVQTVSTGTNWKASCSGDSFMIALKLDGTLWTWGTNSCGSLGNNNTINRSSPVQTVATGTNWRQISGGTGNVAAAIKTDGTLWMWGTNNLASFSGALGDNSAINKSSPVQTVATGTSWKKVNAGLAPVAVQNC